MKFLITVMLLISSTAFAHETSYIKCYEAPQQNQTSELAYKFKVHGDDIKLVHPKKIDLGVLVYDAEDYAWQCLASEEPGILGNFEACLAEGQRINGLIPVDINEEETVYCEKAIKNWISGIPR